MRHVYALDVACPTCGAPPGLRCHSLVATKPLEPHEPRRRRAREEDARLNPDHVHGQIPLWGKVPS